MSENWYGPRVKQIGSYLNGQYSSGAFPIGIQNLEGLAVAFPAQTPLLADRDPVINEISVGISGNETKVEYVTGMPPLALPDSEGYPLQWWQVTLSPYQEGTGDPAPDNVRPIHGTDKLTIYTDSKYGGLVEWNQIWENSVIPTDSALYSVSTYTSNGVTFTKNSDNSITIQTAESGATADVSVKIASAFSGSIGTMNYVHYIGTGCEGSASTYYIVYGGSRYSYDGAVFQAYNSGYNMWLEVKSGFISTEPITVHPQICNLTRMFGAGNEPSTVEEFRALFPKDYYAYNAGQQMTVDQVNGAQYSPAVITLPETIYSGQVYAGGAVESSVEIDLATIPETRWRFGAALNNGTGYYVYIIGTVSNPTTIISDRYVKTTFSSWEAMSFGQFIATTYLVITVPNECSTLETARDYLINTNKPQFVVSLVTSTSITLTTPSIPTPKGNATVWATAEDGTVDSMEATYIKSK